MELGFGVRVGFHKHVWEFLNYSNINKELSLQHVVWCACASFKGLGMHHTCIPPLYAVHVSLRILQGIIHTYIYVHTLLKFCFKVSVVGFADKDEEVASPRRFNQRL